MAVGLRSSRNHIYISDRIGRRHGANLATHMSATAPAAALRALLSSARSERRCIVMPACHDALSAALIARAGFEVAFMSGYAVNATLVG